MSEIEEPDQNAFLSEIEESQFVEIDETPPQEVFGIPKQKLSWHGFFFQKIELKKIYQPWMLTALIIVIFSGVFYYFWKMGAYNPVAIDPPQKPDPLVSLRFFDVEMRGRKEGTAFFTIFSEEIEVTKDEDVFFEKGEKKVTGEFYNMKDWEEDLKDDNSKEAGGPLKRRSLIWESDKAEYSMKLQNLIMRENVVIVTDKRDRIYTDEMIWSKQTEMLSSNTRSYVRTYKGTFLESDKMDIMTEAKEMFLEGRVYIEMDASEDTKITLKEPN